MTFSASINHILLQNALLYLTSNMLLIINMLMISSRRNQGHIKSIQYWY